VRRFHCGHENGAGDWAGQDNAGRYPTSKVDGRYKVETIALEFFIG
jgi:hypothetical protein